MVKRNKTALVTGAAGLIGSNLSRYLISKNYKVIGIDDLSKGSLDNLEDIIPNKHFEFIKKNVSNLKPADLHSDLDVIVHLAAAKIPRYGNRLDTLLTNTKGTEAILNIAKDKKSKFIFASTSDVYGKNTKLPFDENSDLVLGSSSVARWAYAVSKIYDEQLTYAYWEKYEIPFVIVRFFGIYGPGQHRSWWGGPQSVFIDSVLAGKPIEIHGTGKQSRTYLYIDDAVDALARIIESEKANAEIINIGSREGITINTFAKKISTLVKKPLKVKRVNYQEFTGKIYEDIPKKFPNIQKAEKILGWHPKVSLDQGLKKTVKWHKQNPA